MEALPRTTLSRCDVLRRSLKRRYPLHQLAECGFCCGCQCDALPKFCGMGRAWVLSFDFPAPGTAPEAALSVTSGRHTRA
jgi:hypothetical protein